MCQMCDDYETELLRTGRIEEARKFRAEQHGSARDAAARVRKANEDAAREAARQP